jgi:hypothetical protein
MRARLSKATDLRLPCERIHPRVLELPRLRKGFEQSNAPPREFFHAAVAAHRLRTHLTGAHHGAKKYENA